MQRFQRSLVMWLLLIPAFFCTLSIPVRADHTLADKWKVNVLIGGKELAVWLVQIEEAEGQGKFTGKVLSAGIEGFGGTTIDDVKVSDNSIFLTLSLRGTQLQLAAHAPDDDKSPKQLFGSVFVRGGRDAVRMDRTELKELDPKMAKKQTPEAKDFQEVLQTKTIDARVKALKQFLKKHPKSATSLQALVQLMNFTAPETEGKKLAERADDLVKVASKFGPEMKVEALRTAAGLLLKSKDGAELALKYARKAKQSLPEQLPVAERYNTLEVLAAALTSNNKTDELKEVQASLKKLDKVLDEEFAKTSIPFTPEKYQGRKKKSDRVVVVELFTGAQCPPCVAADVAFDALLKRYKAKDVVLLQYHLHIPGPDPMTNPASIERADFYEVNATPTLFINGQKGPQVGGLRQHAEDRYDTLRGMLDKQLEEQAVGAVKLKAARDGDIVQLTADVTRLKKTGKKVRLHFVLLEELVRYAGRNGQRLHHNVVRGFVGGVDGIALENMSGTYRESLDLKKLKLGLIDYLEKADKDNPFLDSARPLELQHLKAAAFIQDHDSKEILNAALVEVPAE